eukprot:scaffold6888_cov126-Isochrysis_galbana.AAC.2
MPRALRDSGSRSRSRGIRRRRRNRYCPNTRHPANSPPCSLPFPFPGPARYVAAGARLPNSLMSSTSSG